MHTDKHAASSNTCCQQADMYALSEPARAVNIGPRDLNFSRYLCEAMNGRENSHHTQHPLSQPRQPPRSLLNVDQGPFPPYQTQSLQRPDEYLHPYSQRRHYFMSPTTMSTHTGDPFHDFFHYPDDDLDTSAHTANADRGYSFRPVYPSEESFASSMHANPVKLESRPSFSVPAVIPGNVDVSQYEALEYDDWYAACADYDGASSSSMDTYGSSPVTPGTSDGQSFFNGSFGGGCMKQRTLSEATSSFTNPGASIYLSHNGSELTTGLGLPLTHRSFHPSPAPAYFGLQTHHYPTTTTSISLRDIEPAMPITTHQEPNDSNNHIDSPLHHTALDTFSADQSPNDTSSSSAKTDNDDYILHMRRKGYSYKEIKRRGRLRVAESTLRGRVRTLTKKKEERVRRPQWQTSDVSILNPLQRVRSTVADVSRFFVWV